MYRVYDYAIIIAPQKSDTFADTVTLHIQAKTKKQAMAQIGVFIRPYISNWRL